MAQQFTPFGPGHPEYDPNEKERERLRAMSMEERGKLVSLACKSAAEILAGRRAMGIADPEPAPWPESTWEFLRKCAANYRTQENES